MSRHFIDQPVKTYSSGMYVRLGFAVAVHVDPDMLLIDEVLSVGDEEFSQKCIAKIQEMKYRGVTLVFVTHQLDQVRNLCDRALWLDHGRGEGDRRSGPRRRRLPAGRQRRRAETRAPRGADGDTQPPRRAPRRAPKRSSKKSAGAPAKWC